MFSVLTAFCFLLKFSHRNGEQWYNLRRAVQKLMMHPRAGSVYLPAQNTVADDLLTLIGHMKDKNNEVENFYNLILRYTMECKTHYINRKS